MFLVICNICQPEICTFLKTEFWKLLGKWISLPLSLIPSNWLLQEGPLQISSLRTFLECLRAVFPKTWYGINEVNFDLHLRMVRNFNKLFFL